MDSQVFSSDTLAAGVEELRWQGVKLEGSPDKEAMKKGDGGPQLIFLRVFTNSNTFTPGSLEQAGQANRRLQLNTWQNSQEVPSASKLAAGGCAGGSPGGARGAY